MNIASEKFDEITGITGELILSFVRTFLGLFPHHLKDSYENRIGFKHVRVINRMGYDKSYK